MNEEPQYQTPYLCMICSVDIMLQTNCVNEMATPQECDATNCENKLYG